MIKSTTTAALLLLLTGGKDHAIAFSPRSMAVKRTISKSSPSALFLWVDTFSRNGPPASLESRVQDCLQSLQSPVPSTETIQALLQDLETLQNDCTEEGNQTKDECDIALKEKRDDWVKVLEDYMASTAIMDASSVDDASTSPITTNAILPSATSSSEPLEAQVQSCLKTASVQTRVTTTTLQPLTLFHVAHMQQSLEDLHNECTEEGNQTEDECDVVRMQERQSLLIELDQMLQMPTLELVQATLDELDAPSETSEIVPNDWLFHFTQWLQVLEEQTNLCTEEGHQTSDMCNIDTMDWRSSLLLRLEDYIAKFQTQATHTCLEYQLCNTQALAHTFSNLEELELLCTEEGNQTRSFCSLESKDERLALMDQIMHQLELAETIKLKRDLFFQI